MKKLKCVQMRQQLWLLVSIIWLITSCQTDGRKPKLPENTLGTSALTPATQSETPTSLATASIENVQPTFIESPISSPATATKTPTSTSTSTPVTPTATVESPESHMFDARIALMAQDSQSNPSATVIAPTIGIFDTQAGSLETIAQPADNLSFGRPLWSPDRNLLAFAQIDSNTSTYSIQVFDLASESNHYLEVTQPQSLDGDNTIPGLFLFGWSGNGEWLAYDYTYDALWLDPRLVHLLNVSTGENVSVEIPNPENYLWFVWSPHNTSFAITNGQAILIGDVHSPDRLTIHQGDSFVGRITWHPSQNRILVGSRGNRVLQGFNQLQQLNLDTNEWLSVGSYPHIAHIAFSPDGQSVAIHSQYPELNRLEIVDANTFEAIHQIGLPSELLFDLDWLNDRTIALTSKDNIFVIPLEAPTESYWVLGVNNRLYDSFSQITFTDW